MDNILNIDFDVENLSKDELSEAREIIVKNLFLVEREKITAKKLGQNTDDFDKQKKHLSRQLYKVRLQMVLTKDSY